MPGHSSGIEKWLKLINAEGVGPVSFRKMLAHFGAVDGAFGASAAELMRIDGIGSKKAEAIIRTRDAFDAAGEVALASKLGVAILSLEDERYPPVLKRIYDPPPVLYVKGELARSDNLAVAIVGSRRCSIYGREQASRFAHLLAAAGFTITSGLAAGIDTAAHQGALAAGGRTIAVQGCGLANVYPPENKGLSEMITKSGAVVSELPLRYESLAENFPPRNRIIAGLSLGTIVVEAGNRSGALITAQMALENDREVMAVPGRVDSPLSKGCHELLRKGATLVESIDDVTEALGHFGQQLKEHSSAAAEAATEKVEAPLFDVSELKLSDNEREIYDCLGNEPIHLEEIIAEADLSPGSINAGLISLRLKGLIKQLPGSMFIRR